MLMVFRVQGKNLKKSIDNHVSDSEFCLKKGSSCSTDFRQILTDNAGVGFKKKNVFTRIILLKLFMHPTPALAVPNCQNSLLREITFMNPTPGRFFSETKFL